MNLLHQAMVIILGALNSMWFNLNKRREENVEKSLLDIVKEKAEKYGLDYKLVSALIWQESRGKEEAIRLEQRFYRVYVREQQLSAVESALRSTSFGYCQIMGQTAREFGFDGDFREITKPEVNIELGCKILARYTELKGGSIERGLLRYNGGGNKSYPTHVMNHLKNGNWQKVFDGLSA